MTDISLPAPFVPASVDLHDFPYLPIDIGRLFGSEFHARSNDAEWRAGVTLWLKSFHEMPAGSLPDDDVVLARLAEFGRDVAAWQDVRNGALRNWVKCSDGRLYHPTVAVKALEAWISKVWQRRAGTAGNAKRWKMAVDLRSLDLEHSEALAALAKLDPKSPVLNKHRPAKAIESSEEQGCDRDPITTRSQPDPESNSEPIASEVKGREDILSTSLHSVESDTPACELDQLAPEPPRVVQLRPSNSARAKKLKRAQTGWPPDLALTEDMRRFGEERGYRGRQADDLWQTFHDKSLAKGWTYVDWQAAWRNFVQQQVKFDSAYRHTGNAQPRARPPDV